jgi:hypothetical protein
MEEIFKKIENEIKFIKEQEKKLEILTESSKEAQDELKKVEEERNAVTDKESGFYKDLSEKVTESEKAFREEDIKRMNKDREINKLVSEKKESILKDLEAKKQYIDENRNIDLQGIDLKQLKEEKEKLEKEIKLNDTTKQEFELMSDSDKKAVRKAKENYLNNKHRLEEINPKIELIDILVDKSPKDKFMEIENLIKNFEEKFDRKNMDALLSDITVKTEKKEVKEEGKDTEKDTVEEENKDTEKNTVEEENKGTEKEVVEKENNNVEKEEEPKEQKLESKEYFGGKDEKNYILLDISNNKIKLNEKEFFYKRETKNKEALDEKYGIGEYTGKAKKNVDYALISTLEKIDESLVDEYLKIIRNGNVENDNIKESVEKLNSAVDIEYKFDKENGIFANWKEKRIARNAKKLGIASLDGISEKSVWEMIKEGFSKIKNAKLLKGKEETKALESGERNTKQDAKDKTIALIQKDREELGLRDRVKVANEDNRIEKNAQELLGESVREIREQEGKEEQK